MNFVILPSLAKPNVKIFQIGFNRCGTKTLHNFFRRNGLKSVHYDGGRLAKRMFSNIVSERKLLDGYEECTCFTDMENIINSQFYFEGYKLYRYLNIQYPDSYFILNTRNVDRWIASRMQHGAGKYKEFHKKAFGISTDAKLELLWRSDWERHHTDVLEYFSSYRRFLVFDIESDQPETLVHFLKPFNLSASYFGWYHKVSAC